MRRLLLGLGLLLTVAVGFALPMAPYVGTAWRSTRETTSTLARARALPFAAAGIREANRDIRANHLAIKMYGLPSPSRPLFTRLLHERYGIELRTVAGCLVSDHELAGWNAYNSVMEAEITRRFGADAIQKTFTEAEARLR